MSSARVVSSRVFFLWFSLIRCGPSIYPSPVDFGLSEFLKNGHETDILGSPFWIPPEMIRLDPHTEKADIWSFAISILELANKRPPHRKNALRAMYTVATKGIETPFEKPNLWSDDLHDFVHLCLQVDPCKRPSASELLKVCSRWEFDSVLLFLLLLLLSSAFFLFLSFHSSSFFFFRSFVFFYLSSLLLSSMFLRLPFYLSLILCTP
jgi:serine/threonine protein kinase